VFVQTETVLALPLWVRHGRNWRWTIDGSVRSNLARYANHACDPNAEAQLVRGRMLYRAIKRIRPGEEITIDYGEEHMQLYFKQGCKCAACRPS